MKKKKQIIPLILFFLLGYFLVLMIKITLPYLAFEDNIAFLRIKRQAIKIPLWKIAFYTHVLTSIFTLLAGFTQFSSQIMNRWPKVHRYLGYLYIISILCFAGPSGLIMGVLANGGLTSRAAFVLLSLLWLWTTYKAFTTAKNKQWKEHADFMFRSYALTLSAITLRTWKQGIVYAIAPAPMDLYRVVAWLGWVPNLLLAEYFIHQKLPLKILQKRS